MRQSMHTRRHRNSLGRSSAFTCATIAYMTSHKETPHKPTRTCAYVHVCTSWMYSRDTDSYSIRRNIVGLKECMRHDLSYPVLPTNRIPNHTNSNMPSTCTSAACLQGACLEAPGYRKRKDICHVQDQEVHLTKRACKSTL